MPSYRPPISRDQYHELEAYYFRLVMFTDSVEYKDLSSKHKNKVDYEISYMSMTLDIMTKMFASKGSNERPVVAYLEKTPPGKYQIIYRFSCAKVAGMALGCNPSKIAQVCKGERKSTGGEWKYNKELEKKEWVNAYVFQYEEDYDAENEMYNFDASSDKFEIK